MVLKSTEPSWRRKIVIPCIIGAILFASYLPLMINTIRYYQAYRETVRQEQEAEKERESRRVESFEIRGYGYEITLDKWLIEEFDCDGPSYIDEDGNLIIDEDGDGSCTYTFYSKLRSKSFNAGRLRLLHDPSEEDNGPIIRGLTDIKGYGRKVEFLCYPVDKNGLTYETIPKNAFKERRFSMSYSENIEWVAVKSNFKYIEIGYYSFYDEHYPILAITYDSIENLYDKGD